MYRGEERRIQGFCWGNLRERDHLEHPGVYGRIIYLQDVECGGKNWNCLFQDKDRWRARVKL